MRGIHNMIYDNILEAIGHTPMVRLNRMVDDDSAQILVKFEGLNAVSYTHLTLPTKA